MLCSIVNLGKLQLSKKTVVSLILRFVTSSQQLQKRPERPENWGSRRLRQEKVQLISGEMDPAIEEQLTPLRQAVKEQVKHMFTFLLYLFFDFLFQITPYKLY